MIERTGKVSNGCVKVSTGLPAGTRVEVKVIADQMADIAAEAGARSAVDSALEEGSPLASAAAAEPKVREALMQFAKAFGRNKIWDQTPAVKATVHQRGDVVVPAKWPDGVDVTVRIQPLQ